MGRSERRKGVDGEAEVRAILEHAGWTVRGLEGAGDWLAFRGGLALHVESKRQETARPWQWIEQAASEAPEATIPVVAFRRNRSEWHAIVPLRALADSLLPPAPRSDRP